MTDFSKKERLKYSAIGLVIILIFAKGVFEFKWIQNTLNAKMMLLIFATIGLTIGGMIGHSFARKSKDVVDKMRFYLLFIAIGIIVLPILGSLTNRTLSFYDQEYKNVELFEQEGFMADLGIMKGQRIKPNGYFTFLIIDGRLERFKSKKILFPGAKKGDMVDLKVKKGLYGFLVVYTE